MGSRPRLVAESFSKLPSALNTWEISHRRLGRGKGEPHFPGFGVAFEPRLGEWRPSELDVIGALFFFFPGNRDRTGDLLNAI